MVFSLKEFLDLSGCSIEVNPRLVRGETKTPAGESRLDQPLSDGRDSIRARGKHVHHLGWRIMLTILGRLWVRHLQKQFFQAVHVLLRQAEAHGEDLVRVETAVLDPVERLGGAPLVDYMSSRPRRRRGDGARREEEGQ